LGKIVSAAGDINGDGFDDIMVGAPRNDDAGSAAGVAYLFFGSSTLSGTFDTGEGVQSADVTIFGKLGSDNLGLSLSGAGDINGDGFDDVIIGAYGNDDGAATAGAAYIFFGATNLSGTKSLGGRTICRCDHSR